MVCPHGQYTMDLLWICLDFPSISSRSFMVWYKFSPQYPQKNIIVTHSFQLWLKHKNTFKLSSTVPPLASFLGDPRFTQAYKDHSPLTLWLNNNLTSLKSIVCDMKFPTFEFLQSKYGFPNSEHPRYIQIKNFFANHYALSIQSPNTIFEHIYITSLRDRGLISQLYSHLNRLSFP